MIYPLVRELAATGTRVRVPGAEDRQAALLSMAEAADFGPGLGWINAAKDAHSEAPTFGYRLIADELEDVGFEALARRAWQLCSQNGIASTIGRRKRGKTAKQSPPVHDDLVGRAFTAIAANQIWLTDITEHWTGEGKLHCCAIEDVFSNRTVGYSIVDRITADLAVAALRMAIQRRCPVGTTVHSDRGTQASAGPRAAGARPGRRRE